jgi:glucose-6-phosphate dehydrogenase assembly protein OpcA
VEDAVIVDLPDTTTGELSKRLVRMRSEVGAMALSRVLTLLVVVEDVDAEAAIEVANEASRQHPCRIVVIVEGPGRGRARLDGQIRVGGDAGASEVVVCRLMGPLVKHAASVVTPLLLPDSPIVVWWPRVAPRDPAADPIGAMAQRRITDAVHVASSPRTALKRLGDAYAPGDTDLAWGRITRWRGLLAAALDQAPFESVESAVVVGAPDSPSADLLAGWLHARLRCPVHVERSKASSGVIGVRLTRPSGVLDLHRPVEGNVATLTAPGQPQRTIALAHRSDAECLAEELRRLDPDEIYEQALTKGVPGLSPARSVK